MARSIGLVLGAGGYTGNAYLAGGLAALVDTVGWDPRSADVIIGTSAGSIVAALLRADVSANDQFARVTGQPLTEQGRARGLDDLPPVHVESSTTPKGAPSDADNLIESSTGPANRLPGSPGLLVGALRRARPGLVAAAAAPRGAASTSPIGDLVRSAMADGPPWPDEPLWITAIRASDGKRTVFGRDDVRVPDLATAVEASCAMPGQFEPVRIGEHGYLDGGAHSSTNADLAARLGLDLVVVFAPSSAATPMVEADDLSFDRVKGLIRTLASGGVAREPVRRAYHHEALRRELDKVSSKRTEVIAIEPNDHDLDAMGEDPMDRSRSAAVAERAYGSVRSQLLGDTRFLDEPGPS